MSEVRLSIKLLEVVKANLESVFYDPYLGPKWLPIASTALAVLNEHNSLPLHCCHLGSVCEQWHAGPKISTQILSDGQILMKVSANDSLSRKLDKRAYEEMEFLGFITPRTDNGEYALKKKSRSSLYDKQFVRIFDPGTTNEHLVSVALNILSYIFKCEPHHRYHFGKRKALSETARSAGFMDPCEHVQPYAPFFFLKGNHPCKVTRLDGSEIMPNG